MAGDGHVAGIESLPGFVSVVCEREGHCGASLERRTDKFSCRDFLVQADQQTHQQALPLVQLTAILEIQVGND